MRASTLVALAIPLLLSVFPAMAVSGQVQDEAGAVVDGVRVCHYLEASHIELMCVGTRDDGYFELPDSKRKIRVRIAAPGYFAQSIPSTGHATVILRRSPTLVVKLVDRETSEPIESGDVFVIYASATKKGPFPVNAAGVRISRILEEGEIRILARADGYLFDGEEAVTLKPGEERVVIVKLSPLKEVEEVEEVEEVKD